LSICEVILRHGRTKTLKAINSVLWSKRGISDTDVSEKHCASVFGVEGFESGNCWSYLTSQPICFQNLPVPAMEA